MLKKETDEERGKGRELFVALLKGEKTKWKIGENLASHHKIKVPRWTSHKGTLLKMDLNKTRTLLVWGKL